MLKRRQNAISLRESKLQNIHLARTRLENFFYNQDSHKKRLLDVTFKEDDVYYYFYVDNRNHIFEMNDETYLKMQDYIRTDLNSRYFEMYLSDKKVIYDNQYFVFKFEDKEEKKIELQF